MAKVEVDVNENEIAREVAQLEGGKVSLSIAQVKEVLACLRHVLGTRSALQILALFEHKECKKCR
jgi:uncharacterized protein with PhoU and TrkA domain